MAWWRRTRGEAGTNRQTTRGQPPRLSWPSEARQLVLNIQPCIASKYTYCRAALDRTAGGGCPQVDRANLLTTCHPEAAESSAERTTPNGGICPLGQHLTARKKRGPQDDKVGGSHSDYYCLITVPSRFRISPHPPFKLSGPDTNGALAAAFSSISIPQPGCSLTHRYPSFIAGQP